jgi:hypothetical protein
MLKKGKDIPVTGHGGPWGCERLRLPHYLDKRLIDGGKVVSHAYINIMITQYTVERNI